MHINFTPYDVALLRTADRVMADIRSDERCLRVENYALADKLMQAEEEIARLNRIARLLWWCVVALIGAFAGIAMGVMR